MGKYVHKWPFARPVARILGAFIARVLDIATKLHNFVPVGSAGLGANQTK